ncbi:hypothetical protein [Clostridium sp. chh4-2]|nr:hypothetical protein [Clostridium sp. chh4-2]
MKPIVFSSASENQQKRGPGEAGEQGGKGSNGTVQVRLQEL